MFRLYDASGAELAAPNNIKTVHILTVDDTPLLTVSSPVVSYREGDGKVFVDAGVTLVDPDTEELNSAYLEISSGYVSGQDSLNLDINIGALDADLTATWDNVTARYTIFGLATAEAYQTVLRSISFSNENTDLQVGNRTMTFYASDQSTSSTAQVVFVVTDVNQLPVLTLTKTILEYLESANGPVDIDNELTVSDLDSAGIVNCTISITQNFDPLLDSLSIPDSTIWNSQITATWDNVTGVLTLAGSANIATYQV